MEKIIVTGANGYIGSHVTAKLLKEGCEVIALDRNGENIHSEAQFAHVDILKTPEIAVGGGDSSLSNSCI